MSSPGGFLLLIPYTALGLLGIFQLKTSPPGLNAGFVLGFAAYAGSFLLWVRILKLLPVSVAFPTAAGVIMIGTQLVGLFLLGEQLTLGKGLGLALILGGIVLLRGNAMAG
jgi:multidrug transporter EmrE-like cation transporter